MYRSSPLRSIAIGPQKRALREKKEEKKQEIPMGGGCNTARAQRHPEGTTRMAFLTPDGSRIRTIDLKEKISTFLS